MAYKKHMVISNGTDQINVMSAGETKKKIEEITTDLLGSSDSNSNGIFFVPDYAHFSNKQQANGISTRVEPFVSWTATEAGYGQVSFTFGPTTTSIFCREIINGRIITECGLLASNSPNWTSGIIPVKKDDIISLELCQIDGSAMLDTDCEMIIYFAPKLPSYSILNVLEPNPDYVLDVEFDTGKKTINGKRIFRKTLNVSLTGGTSPAPVVLEDFTGKNFIGTDPTLSWWSPDNDVTRYGMNSEYIESQYWGCVVYAKNNQLFASKYSSKTEQITGRVTVFYTYTDESQITTVSNFPTYQSLIDEINSLKEQIINLPTPSESTPVTLIPDYNDTVLISPGAEFLPSPALLCSGGYGIGDQYEITASGFYQLNLTLVYNTYTVTDLAEPKLIIYLGVNELEMCYIPVEKFGFYTTDPEKTLTFMTDIFPLKQGDQVKVGIDIRMPVDSVSYNNVGFILYRSRDL